MGLGAIFAALNTMYSAVSARTREIATLRAIGFGAGGVVVSVLVEALLLALIGAVIGAAIAWLHVQRQHRHARRQRLVDRVQDAGRPRPCSRAGVLLACAVGFIGGLFPAVRAARLPVATALRAV